MPNSQDLLFQRRRLLRLAGSSLLAAPVLGLIGCRSPAASAEPQGGNAPADGEWASGGTAAIGDPARFPDPFSSDLGGACVLTCMTTIGPCHDLSPLRSDVSDGWAGIPLRLALRVVDAQCQPVRDAIVEIWHTNYTGGYSGQIQAMCTNDENDLDKQFFRGYQRTDENGVVNFDTCYPGWYRGRAVHIHLRVMTGDYDADDGAQSSVTTQLLFPDALNQQIFTAQSLYRDYGQPDTQLATDGIVGAEEDFTPYLFDVQRMDDGVMFASKTLVIRTSLDETVCEAQGQMPPGGGPGGPGGPPPEGFGPPPDGRRPPGPPPGQRRPTSDGSH
ncbi:intradiol ring-cleavage dioxygenase [Pseudoxanthomonas kalamensis DSM 18571]|uniref:dioxygenase family protein n=1 Tax=Pseudoxanthomonas kalamensis TaxID=289483 RepID=UPI001391D778|nr:intradiol ring-cleavage dioxygenase [Pseudoxanthomonas kalamensis]KAF1710496.1 intradiol ring-cleavage dioxygenase [Pseudoxanthomonas kalamensis DSM 18571]